LNVLI